MSSIFRSDDNFVDKPNRNTFDLSFQNNLTTKFGVLKPVYCQEVIPGDTIKNKPTMAMRFMPQVFPVQTRMRAHLHFFYVRNRNLWKDWEDFIGKTKDGLVPPYLQFNDSNKSMLEVGGIADSFGVPVVTNSDVSQSYNYTYQKVADNKYGFLYDWADGNRSTTFYNRVAIPSEPTDLTGSQPAYNLAVVPEASYSPTPANSYAMPFNGVQGIELTWKDNFARLGYKNTSSSNTMCRFVFLASFRGVEDYYMVDVELIGGNTWQYVNIPKFFNQEVSSMITDKLELKQLMGVYLGTTSNIVYALEVVPSTLAGGLQVKDIPFGDGFPYWNSSSSTGDNALKISALPFRAYEAIYNSFYRNAENNPLLIDGVPEYNKYNRTYEGGADTNNYELFNRNWEDDFLTTALPSPQQGTAPLVGIVNRGDAPYIVTLADEDGNQSRVKFTYQNGSVQVASDDDVSQEVAGQLNEYFMESTNVGISIQDFRNVNSFQRWLENNIRKGFKYRDQIKGHFGVSVRYDILDMPEFIGGVSRDVSVQQVTQTSEGTEGNLGDYAGQAYAYGEGETISHYCDEHGYIIGILSVVPMANYSQMMPKHLMKRDAFDYYFPEFGKIGMQPILNKEVTTLESLSKGNQDEVFGYQRAWYDYIARVDEVHGLFTTSLRNFLIGRTFKDVPQLSAAFSTINNDQLNNIFYVNDGADKILGQIYFNVTGIRPIPVFGIPSIE